MDPIIEVENLSKVFRIQKKDPGVAGAVKALFRPRYEAKSAVDGISFIVEPGEIVGYIGVNGAGKSTTIKMLTGILVPTSGEARVLGRDPHRERIANARQIGVVFGQRTQLWYDLPVIESFELLRDIYRVPQPQYEAARDELIAMLQIEPILDTPVRQLSLRAGSRPRCRSHSRRAHGRRRRRCASSRAGMARSGPATT